MRVSTRNARWRRALSCGLGIALMLGARSSARATGADDLCTGNPCVVDAPKLVDAASVIEFPPGTDLVFLAAGDLTLEETALERSLLIRAASITLQPGARIVAPETDIAQSGIVALEATDGDLRVERSGTSTAEIDVSGNSAGFILLRASASVQIDGVLDGHSLGEDGTGGSVDLTAVGGTIAITRDIDLHGTGPDGGGGSLTLLAAGNVTIDALVDAKGGGFGGGDIDVTSEAGEVLVLDRLDVSDPRYGGGGDIDLRAAGDVTVAGILDVSGANAPDFGDVSCGDGGLITILSGGAVSLSEEVKADGASPDCSGGDVDIRAGTDFVQGPGADIDASGAGAEGTGGSLFAFAGRDVALGLVDASAPLTGGTIEAYAGGAVSVVARLDARGTGDEGTSGDVLIDACDVSVAATGIVDTRGDVPSATFGNRIVGRGAITIAGTMQAAFENRLVYRATPPVTVGATILPAAVSEPNPALPACSATTTCGNGTLDAGEACDDGGHASCDGCNPDCSRVDGICGDGTRECGEQCDDGGTASGDGCEADCTLPPTSFVMRPGSPRTLTGCQAEWKLFTTSPSVDDRTGLPRETQKCVDGDPGCDADHANDGACDLRLQVCLRVADARLPLCQPGVLDYVKMGSPDPLDPANPVNYANGQTIANALADLGVEVRHGTTVVFPGAPDDEVDHCTAPFTVAVPHAPGNTGKKNFGLAAADVAGVKMKSNALELWCQPNSSVCGNDVVEPLEGCDDGAQAACDGCSAGCQVESCGNGAVECAEECDDGAANGTPESGCTASCTEAPPPLRIAAGRSPRDCATEWALALDDADVALDRRSLPRNRQSCSDGDPSCDFDATPGTCRLRLWACLGGADARLGCSAAGVAHVDVLKPDGAASGSELAARQALVGAIAALGLPTAPGERCTSRIEVDVPVGKKGLKLRTRALLASGGGDGDALKLVCR